jgi:DNA replication protein DnaC
MNINELQKALRALRLSAMADTLESRLLQAQTDNFTPIDFLSILVNDALVAQSDRLLSRRTKRAEFRDASRTLDAFDFTFNPKMNKRLVFELATCQFITKHEDVLFLGPPGTGKSHLAQAIGFAAITQGHRVLYREAHVLLEELADATLDGKRKELMQTLTELPLLIIDDLGMRRLPANAAEELLELIMRRHERTSTMITSNRPVEDWATFLSDVPAVTALLDRMLHHGHVLKCGPRSFRTRNHQRSLPQMESVG